jgi:hypothetical protein
VRSLLRSCDKLYEISNVSAQNLGGTESCIREVKNDLPNLAGSPIGAADSEAVSWLLTTVDAFLPLADSLLRQFIAVSITNVHRLLLLRHIEGTSWKGSAVEPGQSLHAPNDRSRWKKREFLQDKIY